MDKNATKIKSHEACRLAGVSYRQFQYWMTLRLVNPYRKTTGSGNYVTCDQWHVVTVYALRYLIPLINSPELLPHDVEGNIRREEPLCIVVNNGRLFWCKTAEEAVQIAMNDLTQRRGDTVHIITLKPVYEALKAAGWDACPVAV